jgi:hypothetical protein
VTHSQLGLANVDPLKLEILEHGFPLPP